MANIGRPKKIEHEDQLLDMFLKYKEHTKSNPRYKYQLCQRSGEMVPEPLEVPLTLEGFEIYCYDTYKIWVEHYFRNESGTYDNFCTICTYIKRQIREDQIKGGMVGQYNPSITQRLNGLTDKQQIDTDGKIEVVFVKGKTIL